MAELSVLKRPQDPDVVAILEQALEDAKNGEVSGVLLLEQRPGGSRYHLAGIEDRFAQTGYLYHVLHRLQYDLE